MARQQWSLNKKVSAILWKQKSLHFYHDHFHHIMNGEVVEKTPKVAKSVFNGCIVSVGHWKRTNEIFCFLKTHRDVKQQSGAAVGCVVSVVCAGGSFVWVVESQSRYPPLPPPHHAACACYTSSAQWRLSKTHRYWSGRSPAAMTHEFKL